MNEFVRDKGKLIEKYKKIKEDHQITVETEDTTLVFGPGKHNELQSIIITEFKKRFFPNSELLYVGDAARKMLYHNREVLKEINVPITRHDKLPDVVFYDRKRNFLLLIEAVTSHGPISPKRQIELEETLKDCIAKSVYISAFSDFREFKQYVSEIAWETEVWVAENPDHMIHFNGPNFLNVHEGETL